MLTRRDKCIASSQRLALAGILLGFLLFPGAAVAQYDVPASGPVKTSLLPPGFFDAVPYAPGQQAAFEADQLVYDAVNDTVTADGDVVMTYQGFILKADHVSYNQQTGAVTATGSVFLVAPDGSESRADSMEVTGELKRAFVQSLAVHLADGSIITADSADYSSELEVVLENGMYSPCGTCIDAKGRRIGWKVRANRMIYHRPSGSLIMESPVLELLGIPMAWIPWIRLPDPSQPRLSGFRMPEFDYTPALGATVTVPYFIGVGEDTDILLSPRLMSRQGGLFAAEVIHRVGTLGTIDAKIAGVYQLDRTAFAGTVGDRDWRGAIQTSGRFVPFPTWTAGWSYTVFSDPAFLPDYKLTTDKNLINQAYAIHLSRDYYADLRIQRFNVLGNVGINEQDRQALVIPNIFAASTTDLPPGWGQLRTALRIMGIQRGVDHTGILNGVPYVMGYRENKAHATIEASWQDQIIVPGGIAITPYLGLRADAAWYDGSSPLLPGAVSLLTATPIAALDVRWPLIATAGDSSFLFEPITQIAYRGSNVTAPGITNDNALSFVFDDTLLFSYDRFSGTDRQETGLRANIGGHFLADFEDGSWLDLVAGQSYFLSGVNSFAVPDAANVGRSSGLDMPASYFVVGAKAGIGSGFAVGAKAQIATTVPRVALAAAAVRYNTKQFEAGLDYIYLPKDAVIGTTSDLHEVVLSAGLPFADYWKVTGSLGWDIVKNNMLEATAGIQYDDGYLVFGASVGVTGPTHTNPTAFGANATFRLKGPAGDFGLTR
jgi:LPS-assembly protein